MPDRRLRTAWRARRAAVLAVAAVLCAAGAGAAPARYVLDLEHSWVQFELLHFGTATIRGRLGPARGVVELDREAATGVVSIELDTASVDTGFKPFDTRIRQPDLLATDAHPRAWFVARQLRFDGPRLTAVRGEFTLRDTSRALELTAERFACGPRPGVATEVCGGDFVGRFARSDFGIDFGQPFVGDEVTLRVQVEAVRDGGSVADRPR